MSIDIHYGFYSKECNNDKILPYLSTDPQDVDTWLPGKNLKHEFYELCNNTATKHDLENNCYIFENNIFNFAEKQEVPVKMADFIVDNYTEKAPLFIIWIR